MTIKTKCIRDPADMIHDGLRVMIAKYWPKGVDWSYVDMRCMALAPSDELVKQWLTHKQLCKKNNDIELLNVGWNDFKKRLMQEYNNNQPQFSHIIVIDIWLKS